MIERRAGNWLLACVLIATAAGADTSTNTNVCVPAADGRWNCGSGAEPPVAAALPERPDAAATAVPPVLLMDPNRFRVSDPLPAALAATDPERDGPQAVSAAPAPPAPATAAVVQTAPRRDPAPATPPAASRARPTQLVTTPRPAQRGAGLRDFATVARAGYTLQLAAAQSTDGFLRRLGELQVAADHAFAVPAQRGGATVWLLCMGEFADARSAMAAVPAGAAGAFAKPLAQLHAEAGR